MKIIIWDQINGQNPIVKEITAEETIEEIIKNFSAEKASDISTISITVRGKQIEYHQTIKDIGILENDTIILQKSITAAKKDKITVENTPNDRKPTSNDIDTAEDIFCKLYKDSPSLPPQSQIPVPVESHPLKIQNNAVDSETDVFNKIYKNYPENPPPVKTIPTNSFPPPTRPTLQPPILPTSQPPRWQNNSPPPNPPVYTSPIPQPVAPQKTSGNTIPTNGINVGKSIFGIFGILLIIIGVWLYIGNRTGTNPTFPYAGGITIFIGTVCVGLAWNC